MASNCRKWTVEIVERARSGSEPGADLLQHLRECSRCSERREDEQRLAGQFRVLRDAARLRRPGGARRSRILDEFDAAHRRTVRPLLKWAMAAAAVLLLAVGSFEMWRTHRIPAAPQSTTAEESAEIEDLPVDGSGFVAVPYAPQLAAGEFVSVVRTELQPTALARMGFDVDASYATEIPADVVVGEDGLPRAVRLIQDF